MFELIEQLTLSTDPSSPESLGEYRCGQSGLRHVHLQNSDRQLAFMLAVNTPASDNRGATHALEHMVLCGSQRYPWRDAFFRVERTSVADHLNAVTNECLSTFHFSTRSRVDFQNLADFMIDSCLKPQLLPETFNSEVVDCTDSGSDDCQGVVYNEMRGFSHSPSHRIDTVTRACLYDGNAYGFLSAGHPHAIKKLRLPAVRHFHQQCYHPANMLILTSGGVDATDIHSLLTPCLAHHPVSSAAVTVRHHPVSAPAVATHNAPSPLPQTASLVAWHQGDSGDALAIARSAFLLDMCAGRSDSLLPNSPECSSYQWPAVLNVSDTSSGQITLRFGATGTDRVKPSEVILSQLEALVKDMTIPMDRIGDALERVELQLRCGGIAGFGPDPVHRLHRLANAVQLSSHARTIADLVTRLESTQVDTLVQRLRDETLNSDRVRQLIKHHLVENPRRITLGLGSQNESSPNPDETIKAVETVADVPAAPLNPATSIPITARDVATTEPLLEVHGDISEHGHCMRAQPLSLGVVGHAMLLQSPASDTDWLREAVHRCDFLLRSGPPTALSQTQVRIDVSPWTLAHVDSQANPTVARAAMGLAITATGLESSLNTMTEALTTLTQALSDPVDIHFQRFLQRSRASLTDRLIHQGHRTALYLARQTQPGLRASHAGGGLGLLSTPTAANTDINTILDNLQCTGVAMQGAGDTFTQSTLSPLIADSPGDAPVYEFNHSAVYYPIDGDVNYVARVYATQSLVTDVASRACLWVLAAAARNTWLLEKVRRDGGAYGVGPDCTGDTLGLFSFRDPAPKATLNHFSVALERLSEQQIDDTTLETARVSAHTLLQRTYDSAGTTLSQLWCRHIEFGQRDGYQQMRIAIAAVTGESLRVMADRVLAVKYFDAVLCTKNDVAALAADGFTSL